MSVEIRVFAKDGQAVGTIKLSRVPSLGELVLDGRITGKVIAVMHLPMRDLRGPEIVAEITVE